MESFGPVGGVPHGGPGLNMSAIGRKVYGDNREQSRERPHSNTGKPVIYRGKVKIGKSHRVFFRVNP